MSGRFDRRGKVGGGAIALLLFGALAAPIGATTGSVQDQEGKPVVGAEVCLVSDDRALFCVNTDENGRFDIMDSDLPVRISAKGFHRRHVGRSDPDGPIVLQKAAVLFVVVVDDRTGTALPKSEIEVRYRSGNRLGPFESHRDGVRIAASPGTVEVSASAEGYEPGTVVNVDLSLGEEVTTVVRLNPAGSS